MIPPRGLRSVLLTSLLGATLACQPRVEVDPSVADRPLPPPGAPVDTELAAAGEILYGRSCVACHDRVTPLVGPPLGDVTERRSPEWIRAMVLSPDSMLAHDDTARTLLERYAVPMPDLELDEVRYRAIWEYMRSW